MLVERLQFVDQDGVEKSVNRVGLHLDIDLIDLSGLRVYGKCFQVMLSSGFVVLNNSNIL
jgi:hypothetical protein